MIGLRGLYSVYHILYIYVYKYLPRLTLCMGMCVRFFLFFCGRIFSTAKYWVGGVET